MAWVLNRAGSQQQEGPYEDYQIVELIRSGQVREGYITQPGSSNWIPLYQHAPFAQALQGGAVPPNHSYAHQPSAPHAAHGGPHGPPPPQGHYGAGHQAAAGAQTGFVQPGFPPAGYGKPPPPGGYGQSPPPGAFPPGNPQQQQPGAYAQPQPGAPAAARGASAATKKGGHLGLIIGAALGLVLLVGGGAAAMMMFGGGESRLSAFVPEKAVVFVEVPSNTQVLKGLLGVNYLDLSEVDSESHLNNAVRDFSAAFEIEKGQAQSLLLGAESMAFALGQVPTRGEQPAVLIGFRSASALQPLLESARFTKEGKFGESGARYLVERGKAGDAEGLERSLLQFSVKKQRKKELLVWFEDARVLAFGEEEFLDDIDSVVTKGEKSLGQSEDFGKANFSSDSSAIAYVSPELLDTLKGEDERQLVRDYMDGIDPFAIEMGFVDAGVLFKARGQLKGKRVTADEELPKAIQVDIQQKLPKETLAYIAFASQRAEDGKALKNRALKQIRLTDERAAKELEAGLEQLEQQAGMQLEELLDAVGEQVAFGIAADADLQLDTRLSPEQYMKKTAAVLLVNVGNADAAEKVVKEARKRLFTQGPLNQAYDVTDQGKGFRGVPKDAELPTVSVFFHEELLSIGVGGRALLAQAILALGGKDSLGTDAAHAAAISAFEGKPRMLVWADTGRIGRAVLEAAPEFMHEQLAEVKKDFGVSHKAIRLTGDQRITSGFATYVSSEVDRWDYSVELLNPSAFAIFGALEPVMNSSRRDSRSDADAPPKAAPGFFIPKSGVPQCDGLALVISQCGTKTSNSGFGARARAVERSTQAALQKNASSANKAKLGSKCIQDLLAFQRANKQCL